MLPLCTNPMATQPFDGNLVLLNSSSSHNTEGILLIISNPIRNRSMMTQSVFNLAAHSRAPTVSSQLTPPWAIQIHVSSHFGRVADLIGHLLSFYGIFLCQTPDAHPLESTNRQGSVYVQATIVV